MMKFAHNPTKNNRITATFGLSPGYPWGFHSGIDLGAIDAGWPGDPIFAVADGEIVFVRNSPLAGLYVVIQHKDGCSQYCHLSKISVVMGEKVSAGHIIGLMGNTGNSTATHLHFGYRIGPYDIFWDKDSMGKYVNAINPEPMLLTAEEKITPEVVHWAEKHWLSLNEKGIKVHEKRFEDNIKRGEIFALLDSLTCKM